MTLTQWFISLADPIQAYSVPETAAEVVTQMLYADFYGPSLPSKPYMGNYLTICGM